VTETLAAAWTGVVIVLGVLAVHLPRLVQTWVDRWREQIATSREGRLERASDRAVAAAEEIGRTQALRGADKLSLATEIAGKLAPDIPPPPEVVQASVARLRATSSSQLTPVSLPAGTALSIPVQVVSSEPPPLPPPAKVPASWREDAPTNPQVRR
jgi:hypothetical protein